MAVRLDPEAPDRYGDTYAQRVAEDYVEPWTFHSVNEYLLVLLVAPIPTSEALKDGNWLAWHYQLLFRLGHVPKEMGSKARLLAGLLCLIDFHVAYLRTDRASREDYYLTFEANKLPIEFRRRDMQWRILLIGLAGMGQKDLRRGIEGAKAALDVLRRAYED